MRRSKAEGVRARGRRRTVLDRAHAAGLWRRWWAHARRGVSKSMVRQAVEITRLRLERGFSAGEYYAYGFACRDYDPEEIDRYAPNRWHWRRHLPALNDPGWAHWAENKVVFEAHCASRGLPTAEIHGVYHPDHGSTFDGTSLRTAGDLLDLVADGRDRRFVLKPVEGAGGDGVSVIEKLADGDVVVNGREVEETSVSEAGERLRSVVSRTAPEGLLVQEYVEPHPVVGRLSPSAPGTVRVVTLRGPGGDVTVVGATLRLGRTGSVVDNYGRGGVSISVDLSSGRLGPGRVQPSIFDTWVEAHPDTGVRFEGRELPHWEPAVELCRRAARTTPGLRAVGWDVVVAPGGPVLLEGNHEWDLVGLQLTGGGYLRPEVREVLEGWSVGLPGRSGGDAGRTWAFPVGARVPDGRGS